ncbi:MAG: lipocalin-like domain-containing protein [Rhodothermales bacterium]
MPRILITIGIVLAVLAGSAFFFSQEPVSLAGSVGIGQALAGDTTGYARATASKPIRFPEDHGPHPAFKLEWWYYTGNLKTVAGRRFGYQFTIFRNALAPPDTASHDTESSWRTNQLYFAHFAVSDIEEEEFYAFERFSRGAAGLAGAQGAPFKVWLEDWQAEQLGADVPPMQVRAEQDGVKIDFTMDLAKPIVLQGDAGYSVKGPGYGNASYYYSMTRLNTTGSITIDGETHEIEGLSWMDREWSTSLLTEDQEGWDWFSLHLDDGHDLMYFNVRNKSAAAAPPHADGVLVDAAGARLALEPKDVQLEVLETWTSPKGGVYPSKWRLQVPEQGLDLYIEPYFANQELDLAVRYWEGAVKIEGSAGGKPVAGSGYVELTGYDPNARQFTDGA